jgi:hypothetical protein
MEIRTDEYLLRFNFAISLRNSRDQFPFSEKCGLCPHFSENKFTVIGGSTRMGIDVSNIQFLVLLMEESQ